MCVPFKCIEISSYIKVHEYLQVNECWKWKCVYTMKTRERTKAKPALHYFIWHLTETDCCFCSLCQQIGWIIENTMEFDAGVLWYLDRFVAKMNEAIVDKRVGKLDESQQFYNDWIKKKETRTKHILKISFRSLFQQSTSFCHTLSFSSSLLLSGLWYVRDRQSHFHQLKWIFSYGIFLLFFQHVPIKNQSDDECCVKSHNII